MLTLSEMATRERRRRNSSLSLVLREELRNLIMKQKNTGRESSNPPALAGGSSQLLRVRDTGGVEHTVFVSHITHFSRRVNDEGQPRTTIHLVSGASIIAPETVEHLFPKAGEFPKAGDLE